MAPQRVWDRLSKRHALKPGNIPLDALPTELLHQICSRLELGDVQSFRQACKTFAAVGAEYLITELRVFHKQSSFERLVQIAQHPAGTKATSILFEADCLASYGFEHWKRERETFLIADGRLDGRNPWLDTLTLDGNGGITKRSWRAYQRLKQKEKAESEKASEDELLAGFECYQQYYKDQTKIADEDLDLQSLITCFKNCQRIKSATLTHGRNIRANSRLLRLAYADAMVSPRAREGQASQCAVRQLTTLMLAAQQTGTQLHNLAAGDVSHNFFRQPASTIDSVKLAMKSLKSLYFILETPFTEEIPDVRDIEFDEVEMNNALISIDDQHWEKFIASAPDLRILRISLPHAHEVEQLVPLDWIFGKNTFKELRWLNLSNVQTDKDELVAFLHRHKRTLKYVCLNDIHLTDGTWEDTFRALAGTLPTIQSIHFRGKLTSEEDMEVWWLGWPDTVGRPTIQVYALDLYIRGNGDGDPPQTEAEIESYVPSPTYDGKPGLSRDDEMDYPAAFMSQVEEDYKEEEWGDWMWI